MTLDALIVGAGPAGCLAAIVLARAGARVRVVDRAAFPRDKLCGDTVNPGALALLRRLGIPAAEDGLPIDGMLVTGPRRVRVVATYPAGVTGRAIVRRVFDDALVRCAAAAGAAIDERVLVRGPLLDGRTNAVCGVTVRGRAGQAQELRARIVIAADGRESRVARALALARYPSHPRRWAVGAYFTGVAGMTGRGEMHVRPRHYLGVAPLAGGLANACLVTADRQQLRDPARLLVETLRAEPELADRFAAARMVSRPATLGPLAVECRTPGMPGLLLAGDAAGFIDPMTGDGLRFALRGAELAAAEALRAIERGAADGHLRLAASRAREFRGKWRFNRALRRLAGSPAAVRAAERAAQLTAWPLRRVIGYAGDLHAA